MRLNQLANNEGAHRRKLKVGRGSSSGLGKTCGRGSLSDPWHGTSRLPTSLSFNAPSAKAD